MMNDDDGKRVLGLQLVTAAATGALDMVRLTLSSGADIHFDDDLALRSAAFTGNFETLKCLLESGANAQAAGNEALLYAAKRKEGHAVGLLLSKGASIDDMLRHHRAEVDEDALETLNAFQEAKLSAAFEKSMAALKKPDTRLRLPPRKKPPQP